MNTNWDVEEKIDFGSMDYSEDDPGISDKIFSIVGRSFHLNAEDAEVLAKDAKVTSPRSSAKTFATFALNRRFGCGSAALGRLVFLRS